MAKMKDKSISLSRDSLIVLAVTFAAIVSIIFTWWWYTRNLDDIEEKVMLEEEMHVMTDTETISRAGDE